MTRRGGGIIGYFAAHPTVANLLLVVMLAAGALSMGQIRSQFFPDVVIETVTVSVAWPGAGAEDVDRAVIGLLEPVLVGLDGVEAVRSVAREGRGRVMVDFEPGSDMARAVDEVKAALDTVTALPEGAEPPVVARAAWRDLVTQVAITGPVPAEALAAVADDLVGRLFRAGITRTTVQGIADPEITVSVGEEAMLRHGIGLAEIAEAIRAGVSAEPAGNLTASRLRSGEERRSIEAIGEITLRSGPDGARLVLRDVARLDYRGSDTGTAFFAGDNPAVIVRVDRAAQGDAIAIHDRVGAIVAQMRRELPDGITLQLVRSRAEAISARLDILLDNGILGLALVLGLLFLFLDARTALWVAAGIPAAMLAAIALMHAAGLTINMVSLFALILTLGIVVDDAIVVGEHADHLHRQGGLAPAAAARQGALRMAAPVIASSLTTIIAFAGLTLIGGRMGRLIADIPFTVAAVLAASLAECFLILPAHMRHALGHGRGAGWIDAPSRAVNRGFAWLRAHAFAPAVGWAIRLRYPVLAGALALLAFAAAAVISGQLRFVFFNPPEEGDIVGNFAMLPGATRADSMEMMRELQRAVAAVAARYRDEDGVDPVVFALGQVGATAGGGLADAESRDADLLGAVVVELTDPDLRRWGAAEFQRRLEAEVRRHPLLETLSFRRGRFGPAGSGLEVRLFGADAATLKAAAEDLKARLSAFPIVSAPEDSLAWDRAEIALSLTPLGQALGLDAARLGRELRQRLSGIEAAEFPLGMRIARVTVRMDETGIAEDFPFRSHVMLPSGRFVPLAEVATVSTGQGFATIRRENGRRVVTVTADVDESDPDAVAAFRRSMREEILPALAARWGIDHEQGGIVEQERAFLSDALRGFLACLIGIYACLAWVFASWWRPVVVMAVIPFGLIGAIWGHWLWQMPLSMFSIVGLIGMTGIIVNDSIVLISTIDAHAARRALGPALVAATASRLRAVLLTTLTTVMGMAPLLYEPSVQAQFLKPTVITLVYGLGFGMVLVLVLVPATVAIQADIAALIRALRRGLSARRQPLAAAAPALRIAALGAAGAAVPTLVWHIATGAMPAPLTALAGRLMPGLAGAGAAFGLYLGALAVLALAATGLAAAAMAGARRRGGGRGLSRAGGSPAARSPDRDRSG
ncbi:MAG: multidrug transporter AcrB [Paracoccaceae bacterium]|nr:MAG: multidrug transporter AcrB [Paracoccaceae bacterium]